MSTYAHLLAKGWQSTSSGEPPPATVRLVPHLRAVEKAAHTIADCQGAIILRNLDLDAAVWLPRLRSVLGLSALMHDIGKASSYFQGMVRGQQDAPPELQPVRHELLSVLILLRNSGGIADWVRQHFERAGLSEVSELLFGCVVGAVAGHHLKLDEAWHKALKTEGSGITSLTLYLGHGDLRPLFGASCQPQDETWSLLKSQANYPGKDHAAFLDGSDCWQAKLDTDPEWKRFAAAVKALLVAADVAGSALLPKGVGIHGWINTALTHIAPAQALASVAAQRLQGRSARPFQAAIEHSTHRVTLVEAGCGSGKTAAAWLWAARQCRGRKLFFCYPTTGTATEGFLDYIAPSTVEGELIHSRAAVDLAGIAMSRDAARADEHQDQQLRIASLSAWTPQAVVCTADTVLALPRNNRRGLYGSPAMLGGAFVFDELHAYDDTMFAGVVALIKALLGAPFLLMSASLPAARKAFLNQQLGEIGRVAPPQELEAIARYRLQRASLDDAFAQATEHVLAGKRVLWVCNTVARAQAMFERARNAGLPVVTYHSRFRYKDRVDRHRQVVTAFAAAEGQGLLAVTTQVAEMSLDLDADLLVTELAPIAALIQRLGRLNRRVNEECPGTPRWALVISPDSERPYEKDQMTAADAWLTRLMALPQVSQRNLAEHFQALAEQQALRLDLKTEWLDSGWCAMPGPVREAGFNVNILLDADADACRQNSQELIKRSLPMPYHPRMASWREWRGTLIAPPDAIDYDELKGATWAN